MAGGCSGSSAPSSADRLPVTRTTPLVLTTPAELRDALADSVDRCDPPDPEPAFLLLCTAPAEDAAGGQTVTLALHAFSTGQALQRQLREARANFDEPIPDDPADPENDPGFEAGFVLGDTWVVGVTNDGPVRRILEDVRGRLGGEIVMGLKIADNLDEVIRRLGEPA